MNEKDFGNKTKQFLSRGLMQLEDDKLARLRTARARAMEAYREPSPAAEFVAAMGSGLQARLPAGRKPLVWMSVLLVVAAAGVTVLVPEAEPDVAELDAALLTGELPIDAFLDQDFDTWLKNNE